MGDSMERSKKKRRKPSTVILGREVRVKSVDLYVNTMAEKERGLPPKLHSKPWLIVNGELDEAVKSVREVSISVHREAIEKPWATMPPSIGSVIRMWGQHGDRRGYSAGRLCLRLV